MKPYFIKTPNLIKILFKNWVWSFSKNEKVIYLTFDDGPTPEITEWTLHQLEKHKAQATFFCIGKKIVEHPEIFQKIIKNGHAIGNRTQNHLNNWKTSSSNYLKNINDTEKSIETYSNSKFSSSKLFRPPYGRIKPSQGKALQKLGYKIIMWDVLAIDWDASISEKKVLQNVLNNTESGSIIVLHDSVKASKNMLSVLPKILDYFDKKGFIFKKIEFGKTPIISAKAGI